MDKLNEKIFDFLSEYIEFGYSREDLKQAAELLLKANVFSSPQDMRIQAACDYEIILPEWLFED